MNTFKKILAPAHLSPLGEATVQSAGRVAKQYGAKLWLTHATKGHPILIGATPEGLASAPFTEEEFGTRTQAAVQQMVQNKVPDTVETYISIDKGDLNTRLHADIRKFEPDLILLPVESKDKDDEDHILYQKTVFEIVKKAEVPVIIITEKELRFPVNKVLIPVSTDFGIRELRQLVHDDFRNMQPEITLISVLSDSASESDFAEARTYLEKEIEVFHKEGSAKVSIDLIRSSEAPAEIITHYAHTGGFDLVMMNTHGRSGLGKFFLGSVTDGVIQSCRVPVLAFRPGRNEAARAYYHSWFPV